MNFDLEDELLIVRTMAADKHAGSLIWSMRAERFRVDRVRRAMENVLGKNRTLRLSVLTAIFPYGVDNREIQSTLDLTSGQAWALSRYFLGFGDGTVTEHGRWLMESLRDREKVTA